MTRDRFPSLRYDEWRLSKTVGTGRRLLSMMWLGSLTLVTYGAHGTGFGNGWW